MSSFARRSGMTLIEVLVTMTLIGLTASIATLAVRRVDEPRPDDPMRMIADSLRVAVATGRPITLHLVVNGVHALATIHPDGSIVADTTVPLDRLSGVLRTKPAASSIRGQNDP